MDNTCLKVLINILFLTGAASVYFPLNYTVTIPSTYPARKGIIRVYALYENNPPSVVNQATYRITRRSAVGHNGNVTFNFLINSDGWISLSKSIDEYFPNLGEGEETLVTLTVQAKLTQSCTTNVFIRIKKTRNDITRCEQGQNLNPTRELCYNENMDTFSLMENSKNYTFVNISPPDPLCNEVNVEYDLIPGNASRYFVITGSEISITEALDAENDTKVHFKIRCNATIGKYQQSFVKNITITVIDQNDNPPKRFHRDLDYGTGEKKFNIEAKPKKDRTLARRKMLFIHDRDVGAKSSDYTVLIRNNTLNYVKMGPIEPYPHFKQLFGARMFWNTSLVFPGVYYYDVVFQDEKQREAVWHVEVNISDDVWPNLLTHYNATVNKMASNYYQVLYMLGKQHQASADTPYTFSMVYNDKYVHVFGVTNKTGVIFVKDSKKLQRIQEHNVSMEVEVHNATDKKSSKIAVEIQLDNLSAQHLAQDSNLIGCSEQYNPTHCANATGLASPNGTCQWRYNPHSNFTHLYATCSPNLSTCPDRICDEVEALSSWICPQDCTKKTTFGGIPGEWEMGISQAKGYCYCNKDVCTCGHEINDTQNPFDQKHLTAGENTQDASPTNQSYRLTVQPSFACKHNCQIVLGVSGSFIVTIFVVALLAWRVYKRKHQTRKTLHGSMISLTALPSNYVDRRPSLSNTSMEWTPRFLESKIPVDPKWEFPRKNLNLDKTLGEGEFGKVVKAEARSLDGNRDGYVTVAVKMLKDNATNAEFRDLISEFNLLKDVSHPNVVKLLGACTQNGPLYVIVEFCEYSSLKSYLRKIIDAEERNGANGSSDITEETVTSRDLMQFAWQIAKGMQYLSEMKIVHRDLAARNVLVATGKMIKISDFGLSRDVYEEDTYMKKSKGRIPVKWMAPESLYHQVYTSKSDVWSYGITLWEIVTMGATPYPGMAPETLYQLLKEGYRMQRPENCSKDLYIVMHQCWQDNPLNRPSFCDLADVFDKMLQQDVEYLDVGNFDRNILHDDIEQQEISGTTTNSHPASFLQSEEEDDYGNINMLPLDDSSYLTPLPRPWQDDQQCSNCGAEAILSESGRQLDYACECSFLLPDEAVYTLDQAGNHTKLKNDQNDNTLEAIPFLICENLEYMRTSNV